VERRRDLRDHVRRDRLEKSSTGFTTGVDIFSAEEQAKIAARAAKFGSSTPSAAGYQALDKDAQVAALEERAKKFDLPFEYDPTGLSHRNLHEEKKEVGRGTERRPDTVYLYGVDNMSTRDCKNYFTRFIPKYVEWLNDSSCNVVFADAATAKRAIAHLGKAIPAADLPDDMAIDYDPADVRNVEWQWHRGEDYTLRDGTRVPLLLRMATVEDIKAPLEERKRSRYLWLMGQTTHGGGGGKYGRGRGGGERGRRRRGERGHGRSNRHRGRDDDDDDGDDLRAMNPPNPLDRGASPTRGSRGGSMDMDGDDDRDQGRYRERSPVATALGGTTRRGRGSSRYMMIQQGDTTERIEEEEQAEPEQQQTIE